MGNQANLGTASAQAGDRDAMQKAIASLGDLIRIQTDPDNCKDGYMRGMANGLLLALSVLDGKDPKFIPAPANQEGKPQAMGPCICNRFDIYGLYPNCPTHGTDEVKKAWAARHGQETGKPQASRDNPDIPDMFDAGYQYGYGDATEEEASDPRRVEAAWKSYLKQLPTKETK